MRAVLVSLVLVLSVGCTSGGSRDGGTTGQAVYRCSMDGGERSTPGPCPKCGMQLGERDRVSTGDRPAAGGKYVCPMDGGERTSTGACPKCGMTLDERHLVKDGGDQPPRRVVYVRDCCGGEFAAPGEC